MAICPACAKENPEGFRFCGFCTAPLEDEAAPSGLEERKVVSVLFCDLVGFTAASETADPEDVRARLRPYHELLRERIESFGGTVEKFVGDAVMAVFGAPVAHEDDAERAVRAGLAIIESLEGLNEADAALGLSVRIGVNTGVALVALDARPEQGEGFVMGDVVNTASRIQGAAPVCGIAVGEGTYQATARVFEWEPLEPVVLKGKVEPVALWQPLRARARFGTDVIRGLATPLVGRDLEMVQMRTAFDRVASDAAVQLVTVTGEPGVGKSRLVAELFAYIDSRSDLVTWRQGRCLPYGDGITFWALGEIVKAHAGVFESDAPDEAQAKLERVLPDGDDGAWLRARLLPLLGVDSGAPVAREESFTAWRRFLESIADGGPAVLAFEDIHWADDALLAFLEHLADWAQGVPLLILCTARPELYEKHATWGAGLKNATTVNLSPLSPADTARLVAALLEQAVLPAETQQLLLERAGGNPLYAEEFVRMLRDRQLLDDQGRLQSGVEIAFPESLQALIAARLDTLPPDRKALLQDAAVIGKVFWSGAVAAMGERERPEVEQALHELGRKELVRPFRQSAMEGEQELGFWHVLVRDVAYGQVPRAQRAAKHVRVADWLEQKAGDRVEDVAEVLAYHTGEAIALAEAIGDEALVAELGPKAGRYAFLAGERALGTRCRTGATASRDGARAHARGCAEPSQRASSLGERCHQTGDFPGAADRAGGGGRRVPGARRPRRDVGCPRRSRSGAATTWAIPASASSRRRRLSFSPRATAQRSSMRWTGSPELTLSSTRIVRLWPRRSRPLDLAASLGLPQPARALGFRGAARVNFGDRGGVEDSSEPRNSCSSGARGASRDRGLQSCGDDLGHRRPVEALEAFDGVISLAESRGIPPWRSERAPTG